MPVLLLACLAYLSVAVPGSTLGLLWPSMRLTFGAPVGALGILLVSSITASVISSVAAGRVRLPAGPLAAASVMLIAVALAMEALAPSMGVMTAGTVLFGLGFGALDTVLNTHAARYFGARDINWDARELRARGHHRPPAGDGLAMGGLYAFAAGWSRQGGPGAGT